MCSYTTPVYMYTLVVHRDVYTVHMCVGLSLHMCMIRYARANSADRGNVQKII